MEDETVVLAIKQELPPPLPSSSLPLAEVVSDAGYDTSGVRSTGKRPYASTTIVATHSDKKPKIEGNLLCTTCDADNVVEGQNINHCREVVPVGFLDPLNPLERERLAVVSSSSLVAVRSCRQFWKAGDFEPADNHDHHTSTHTAGMDRVRVHPKFLHSNATSHKWALGAFAELLDNALDELCNGATYVNVDMLRNEKDGSKMLLVQDNGGGMNPDKMRQCMSFGYSAKSKLANTIGQYGNGFKTSTMRLGADVIVFSCCQGMEGSSPTKSIGMLSYTFLQCTGKEDIVVPMIDFEKEEQHLSKMLRSSSEDWYRNLDTIIEWSPYSVEEELLEQFNCIENQGTRIIIYNLWEDDMGQLELDFDADPEDIQMRGVNRDEKKIAMARKYPNSKHFLTYQHSFRSYASILYLRLPPGFRITLRGKDVEHHNLVDDMMLRKETVYKPKPIGDGMKDPDVSPGTAQALVTMGFVKDAQDHIDIQGFNVYHKNRLIRPFWRVWNAAGSDGRGVIGVLEANFVEPAHDKQGFEKTIALSRLETRLVLMQKDYWRDHCHEVGYARRRSEHRPCPSAMINPITSKTKAIKETAKKLDVRKDPKKYDQASVHTDCSSEDEMMTSNNLECSLSINQIYRSSSIKTRNIIVELRKEILELQRRLEEAIESNNNQKKDLQFERDRCKSLEVQLKKANEKIAEMDREQEALVDMISEERERRDAEEESLRKQCKVASRTIEELLDKEKALEGKKLSSCKTETCTNY